MPRSATALAVLFSPVAAFFTFAAVAGWAHYVTNSDESPFNPVVTLAMMALVPLVGLATVAWSWNRRPVQTTILLAELIMTIVGLPVALIYAAAAI